MKLSVNIETIPRCSKKVEDCISHLACVQVLFEEANLVIKAYYYTTTEMSRTLTSLADEIFLPLLDAKDINQLTGKWHVFTNFL